MDGIRKIFAAFVATMSTERFGKQLLGNLSDENESGVMHCTAWKASPPLFVVSSNLLDLVTCLGSCRHKCRGGECPSWIRDSILGLKSTEGEPSTTATMVYSFIVKRVLIFVGYYRHEKNIDNENFQQQIFPDLQYNAL